MSRTVLVTGANKGIGLATARRLARDGLRVLLGSRDRSRGEAARRALADDGVAVEVAVVDVASAESVAALAAGLPSGVDVLVNNAAVLLEGGALDIDEPTFRAAIDANLLGAWRLARAFMPGMVERGYGRVVNVSSGWGSFAEGLGGPMTYAVTKAALNALTAALARAAKGDVLVNACCPGWVRTDMGGPEADRSPDEGADTVAWLATLKPTGPNGGFFRDRKRISW